MKIAHIINPVKVQPSSELYTAQPITFESIRVAKEFASDTIDVELYAICYPEDKETIPVHFNLLPPLKRSVLDVGKFSQSRKYPILHDVLQALHLSTNAEYLIFSNMDISLMPQFYSAVGQLLEEGNDALLINRRGISKKYNDVSDLPLMYSEFGKPHPGFDCFVFHREILPKITLEKICLGVSFSEVALVHNLIAFAKKLKLVDDLHLTFHIGSEVMPPLNREFYNHNRSEYENKIYPKLKPHLDIRKFPYSYLPLHKRMLKWILNPVFRTHQVAEMEGKGLQRRLKHYLDSIRFKLLDKIK